MEHLSQPRSPADAGAEPPLDRPRGTRFTPKQVRAAFSGPIARLREPLSYRLAILAVAPLMLALPAVYFTLVVAIAFAAIWHAINDYSWVQRAFDMPNVAGGGYIFVFACIAYAAPLGAAVAVILAMVRTFLPRGEKEDGLVYLDRDRERTLFALVERLCEIVGAPIPARIAVNCDVNAAAGFRGGVWSVIGRADLDLQLGLPLAGGMNATELVAVLAHELGHFSQGTGMRLTYLVRAVNAWFGGVAYRLREYLAAQAMRASQREHNRAAGLYDAIVSLCIRAIQLLVASIAALGHMASCHLMRQMEHDADRCETAAAGSAALRQTTLKMSAINYAFLVAGVNLREAILRRQFADNLPALVLAVERRLTDDIRAMVERRLFEDRARWYDTHPSCKERIERAAARNDRGVFHLDGPATALFSDFDGLCKMATLSLYRQKIGPTVPIDLMVPYEKLLEETANPAAPRP